MMQTAVIATSTFGRKVHLAPFGRMICGNTGAVDSVIADLGEEGGLDETLTALTSARVAPSKLCSKCFMGRTRAAYMKRCSS